MELIANLCKKHDVLCISDEVYEWLVYPGSEHIKIGIPVHHAEKIIDDSRDQKMVEGRGVVFSYIISFEWCCTKLL